MFKGFKQFILRGNVVDMAVGVVIGAAFASVVSAFTKYLLTPLIAALIGKPDFSNLQFSVNGTVFALGDFIQRDLRIRQADIFPGDRRISDSRKKLRRRALHLQRRPPLSQGLRLSKQNQIRHDSL